MSMPPPNTDPGGYPPAGPPPGPPPGPPSGYGGPPAGPPSYAMPSSTPPRKQNRRGLVILGVLVIVLVVIVGGVFLFRDRITGDVNDLQVGDCIDEPTVTTTVTDVQHQPCTDPHDGEVFALVTYTADASGTYPGESAFDDLVTTQCVPAVETYTSRTSDELDAAGLSFGYFYPTSDSWSSGDRDVTCYIEKSDGSKLVGSVKGGGAASP